MTEFKDVVSNLIESQNGLFVSILDEGQIDSTPFICSICSLVSKLKQPMNFCCIAHPASYYQSKLTKLGVQLDLMNFIDVLSCYDYFEDDVFAKVLQGTKIDGVFFCDNIMNLMTLSFNSK